MSYCRKDGKDIIVFATKEDHEKPSTVTLSEAAPPVGLIFPDGTINWNCPCLGGMATGPCGVEFRDAFSCFHYSKEEPKGSDCFNAFKDMQNCMVQYPTLYNRPDDETSDAFNMSEMDQESASLPPSVEDTKQDDKTIEKKK